MIPLLRARHFCTSLLAGWLALFLAASLHAQPPAGTNWALTFADEFSGTSLDTMKWIYGYPWGPTHNDNTYALPQNVTVGGGHLTLTADRQSYGGEDFTTGVISTGYNLQTFTGGYFEARMLLPSTPGSWPAFWGLYTGWPPEADIMEYPLTSNGTLGLPNNAYNTNFHYSTGSGNAAGAGAVYTGSNLGSAWHTFGMEWVPNTSVAFYLDGNQVSSFVGSQVSQMAYMYMILDYAVGGWPGTPSLSQWPSGHTDQWQVDWVRVWQNTGGIAGSTSWNNTSGNTGSWTSAGEWTGGAPQLSSQTAVFGANSVNNQTVTWNNSQTVGGLTFNSTTSYTIGSPSGSLMLANTAVNSSGAGSGGTVLIDATSASGSGANYIDCRLELYDNTTMQTSSKPLIVNGWLIGTAGLTIAAGPITLAGSSTTTGQITVSAAAGSSAVLNFVPGSLIDANCAPAPSLAAATVAGGTATINMTGGTLATASELWLSSANGASGIMNMSGGAANVGSWLAVGRGGNEGVLNVSGGSLNVAANNLTLASFSGNSGRLNVSGGTVHAVNAIYDGERGTGAMTLSGSGVVTTGGLFIGLNGGASGVYTQSGGLLAANGTAYNASSGTGIAVGCAAGSSGTLNITGGTISGAAPIMVWGGTGSIAISQTGATPTVINAGWITLGQNSGAVGTLTQNGGAITLPNNDFYIGWGSGTTGKYIMHGGSMTAGDIRTDSGTGTIFQDGGAVTSEHPYWIRLGVGASATSACTLAGGTLNANDGAVNVGENGSGVLTIGGSRGGTMLVSPATVFTVANGSGSGTLNLQAGGLLRTPDVAAGAGTAAFNFSGGTLQNALSGNLSVAMAVNLMGPGTVDLDNGQTGTFGGLAPISGGGSLYVAGGGTLTLSGTNTFTGGTDVEGGTMIVDSPAGIESGTNLSVGSASLLSKFGTVSAAGTAPVPEPGTLALTAAAAILAVAAVNTSGRSRRGRADRKAGRRSAAESGPCSAAR